MSEEYERVLLVKPDVFIYKIPPRTTSRGYRASDWKLDEPDWTGRLRLVSKGKDCYLKLEEKASGQLFAQCPVDSYPGPAIESVADSSRYFVLKIVSDTGRSAFIGIGFTDRGDSFDLNVALSDHFKQLEVEKNVPNQESQPHLDLGFKEGQTIKVNLNIAKKDKTNKPKPVRTGSSGILLPPPPTGSSSSGVPKIPAPVTSALSTGNVVESTNQSTEEELNDEFDNLSVNLQSKSSIPTDVPEDGNNSSIDPFSAPSSNTASSSNAGWAQF